MGIGKFRERIDILAITQGAPDGMGGFLTTKESIGTVWARVEIKTGSRSPDNQMVKSEHGYTVTMRAGTFAVTTANIIRWKGKELTIASLRNDEKNRWTIAECNE